MTDARLFANARPYTRWWWFSNPHRQSRDSPSKPTGPRKWLWRRGDRLDVSAGGERAGRPVAQRRGPPARYAAGYAAQLGLGCGFHHGQRLAFGGLHVAPEDAAQTWHGPSPQRLEKSWETPLGVDGGLILNHLDCGALERYARRFGAALGLPMTRRPCPPASSAIHGSCCPARCGRQSRCRLRAPLWLRPAPLPRPSTPIPVRYDYRALIAATALAEFYALHRTLPRVGRLCPRLQCHGAPADIVAATPGRRPRERGHPLRRRLRHLCRVRRRGGQTRRLRRGLHLRLWLGGVSRSSPTRARAAGRSQAHRRRAAGQRRQPDRLARHAYNPPGGSQRFYATTHVGLERAGGGLCAFNAT